MSSESERPPNWNGPANQVYVNALNVAGGAFDVMLTFGLQQPPPPQGVVVPGAVVQPPVDEVVRVSMSWAHAKSIIPLLAKMVADYESKYGEVPAPGFGETWRA